MYKKYQAKGLNLIAVNYSDAPEAVREFRKEFKLTMPIVLGGSGESSVSKKYGVVAYPTTYVLDKDGKVVAQIVGYDEGTFKKALNGLGITD